MAETNWLGWTLGILVVGGAVAGGIALANRQEKPKREETEMERALRKLDEAILNPKKRPRAKPQAITFSVNPSEEDGAPWVVYVTEWEGIYKGTLESGNQVDAIEFKTETEAASYARTAAAEAKDSGKYKIVRAIVTAKEHKREDRRRERWK